MSEQRWSCEWGGDEIGVETWGSGFRFGRRLLINGDVVDEESVPPLRRALYLCARAPLGGSSRNVEAAIGAHGFSRSCKIFVDGEQVGGDQNEATFPIPEPLRWQEIRSRGRAQFLFSRGLRSAAPFAGAMFVFNLVAGRGLAPAILAALLGGLLFGAVTSDGVWQAAERQYQLRAKKLAGSAWVEPPEITPLRRLASLFLVSVGVLLVAIGALIIVIAVGSVESLFRPENALILVPLGVVVLGLLSILAARRLRQPTETGRATQG